MNPTWIHHSGVPPACVQRQYSPCDLCHASHAEPLSGRSPPYKNNLVITSWSSETWTQTWYNARLCSYHFSRTNQHFIFIILLLTPEGLILLKHTQTHTSFPPKKTNPSEKTTASKYSKENTEDGGVSILLHFVAHEWSGGLSCWREASLIWGGDRTAALQWWLRPRHRALGQANSCVLYMQLSSFSL